MHTLPPLSLYVHIPWCVRKCPYCDFNSHQQKGQIPESEYTSHLLADLDLDLERIHYSRYPRSISSIFIGGGTPSLFTPEIIARLLQGIRQRANVEPNAEITIEANPGTFEAERFEGYSRAGINRISIGVQSYHSEHLHLLGRIHDSAQAQRAVTHASQLGLTSFNTDIMHGLPTQSEAQAMHDLHTSIALGAPHISWYQLTIEPNTQFSSKPPVLPDDDILWDIQQSGQRQLMRAGYQQYEISAYSKPGHQSRHNLNYWRFGDYLGIGCGAHGKWTDPVAGTIRRSEKIKHPKGYMDISRAYLANTRVIDEEELPFEFFMNQFRLLEACNKSCYERMTYGRHLPASARDSLAKLVDRGLVEETQSTWQVTDLGRRYLNDVLAEFV